MRPRAVLARRTSRRRLEQELAERYGHLPAASLESFVSNFGYAMAISLVDRVHDLCRRRRPSLVVEFGSGASTVAIADALSEGGGLLVSIDESADWLARTQTAVGGGRVLFVAAPGADGGIAYDPLQRVLAPAAKADLVVIDGPSGANRFTPEAVALYERLLSADAACAIDDTDRPENDAGAALLAERFGLRRVDGEDAVYEDHRYTLLLPAAWGDA